MVNSRTWIATSLLALGGSALAQPAQLWAPRVNINSNARERAAAVVRDNSGSTIAIGNGYVGASPFPVGGNITLRKLSSTGSQMWVREVVASRGGTPNVIAATIDGGGNFAVVYSETGLFTNVITLGSTGIHVAKFRGTDGATLWTSELPTLSSAVGIRRDGSNNFLIAGSADAGIGVVKLNGASGAQLWAASRQPAGRYATPKAMTTDSTGNPIVIGASDLSVECPTSVDQQGYLVKFLGTAGNFSWERSYTQANKGDSGVDVTVDSSNNVIALYDSKATDSTSRAVTIRHTGTTGVPLWTQVFNFPGSTDTSAKRIAVNAANQIYVGGQTSISFLPTLVAWSYAIGGGAPLWSRQIGTAGFFFFGNEKAIEFASNGSAEYIAASTVDFSTFKGSYWVSRVTPATGASAWTQTYAVAGRDNAIVGAFADASGIVLHGTSTLSPTSDSRTVRWTSTGTQNWVTLSAAATRARQEGMNAIARDNSGNVYVTGGSNGAIITAKYNAAGTRLWLSSNDAGPAESFASLFDGGYDIVVDTAGNPIVAGMNRGQCVVMKINGTTGAVIWRRPMTSVTMPFRGNRSLVIDSSNNVFLAKEQDGLIGAMKINGATGGLFWNKTYTPPAGQQATVSSIAIDSLGNVVIAGSKGLTTGTCPDYNDNYQLIAIKYTSAVGAQVWVGVYQGPVVGDAESADLYIDSANNAAVFGTVAAATGTQAALVRFGAGNGAILNQRVYQPAGASVRAHRIGRDTSNNAYCIADVYGSNYIDALTWKWAASGAAAPLWTRRLSGVNGNNAAAGGIAVDPTGIFATSTRDDNVTAYMATYEINPGNGAIVWGFNYTGVASGASGGNDLLVEPSSTNVIATGLSSGTNSAMDGVTIRYRQ